MSMHGGVVAKLSNVPLVEGKNKWEPKDPWTGQSSKNNSFITL